MAIHDQAGRDPQEAPPPQGALTYLGTMGFFYKDWVGPFYPPGTPPARYLEQYAREFDTVELDTTFYAPPRLSVVHGWAAAVPEGFRFAAKLPQKITHEMGLVGAEEELKAFLDTMAPLGEKLGPLLIQLPPQFRADQLDALRRFLALLPGDFRFAIEFRHRSWLREEVFDLLRECGVALASIDLYYMPKRIEVTADWAYLRWLGRRADVQRFDRVILDRTAELQTWAAAVLELLERVTTVYGYFNNHYAGHSPASARQFRQMLGLPPVEPPAPEQPTLF